MTRIWLDQMGLLLLLLGYALFLPVYILSFYAYALCPSFGMHIFFCLFPLSGAFLGVVLGFPVDLFGREGEDDEDAERKERGVFMYIPWGKNRQIAIKEKAVNNCIVAGIILWILLCVLLLVLFADVPKN
jgi:hypothetical protein